MNALKTVLTFLLAGAFLGLATASWLGPKWITWDNTPRLPSTQMMCDLPTIIQSVTSQLLGYQLTGTAIGAAAGLVLGIAWKVTRRKPSPLVPPPAVPSP